MSDRLATPKAEAAITPPTGQLRRQAEAEASRLPPLLVQAKHLASSVILGEHGRRRAGMGDDFWQYRPVQIGDSRRMIDHRQSAKSDQQFVREREWQIAQTVHLWVDQGRSMQFSADPNQPTKLDRARILALAVSILMLRGGERVGLTGGRLPARRGQTQIMRLAEHFSVEDHSQDYAPPEDRGLHPQSRVVFVSDFLGPSEALQQALAKAADRGVQGVLLQILDPSEETFPFEGRTIFEGVSGTLRHETLKAAALKERYLARLAERRDMLDALCRSAGWQFGVHHTGENAQTALMWLFHALQRGRA
ncbi:DUF58 domain-containing protein [Phaeobacter sp.]|uniref:DUF58 domain-containing protein n=1 Tax=Phaeobacter sp. TaxID=1902409 RepID=UPI0025F3F29E|nr:DUF58 domain-containing protein [Phaeobacter sp.]